MNMNVSLISAHTWRRSIKPVFRDTIRGTIRDTIHDTIYGTIRDTIRYIIRDTTLASCMNMIVSLISAHAWRRSRLVFRDTDTLSRPRLIIG